MTSEEAPTVSATATRQRSPHATSGRRRPTRGRTLHDSGDADSSRREPAPSPVRSAGRFLALAARPIRVVNDTVSVLLSALVFGGLWATLTFVVAPGVRHVTAQTPFGPHELTVAVSRAPWGVATACALGAALLLIAGIRLNRDAARHS